MSATRQTTNGRGAATVAPTFPEPRFSVGDRVFICGERDSVLGRYPYTVGSRFRYGGATCWSWNYGLLGISGHALATVFEDQIESQS